MSTHPRLRALFALLAVLGLSLAFAACGDDSDDTSTEASGDTTTEASGDLIQSNPDNGSISLTVGSKNFTEQFILGEIYAQGLEAAGYDVSTDLNLGDEQVALKALQNGEISGYPEYTSTALTSFFGTAPEDVPGDAQQALRGLEAGVRRRGPGLLSADPVLERKRGRDAEVARPKSSGSRRSPTSRTTRT